MLGLLRLIGAQARWFLIAGVCVAVFVPALSSWMRPALPALISLVLGLSVARMELLSFMRQILQPHRLAFLVGLSILLMPVTAVVLGLLTIAGPGDGLRTAAILFALAPPISSAAALCFLLGFDARRALELTLVATLLTPLVAPPMIAFLLPGLGPPPVATIALDLATMIFGGIFLGIAIRMLLGSTRIAALSLEFDGISAVGMVLFAIPLFDGFGAQLIMQPKFALVVFMFACVLNLGSNFVVAWIAQRAGRPASGAMGLMWGNRTVALYLAALPYDPVFGLFVALYQFPMYATPLIFGRTNMPGSGSS